MAFLNAGLRYAAERFAPEVFTLEVAAVNQRAIAVYQRAGFVEVERFEHRTNGGLHPFVRMSRGASQSSPGIIPGSSKCSTGGWRPGLLERDVD